VGDRGIDLVTAVTGTAPTTDRRDRRSRRERADALARVPLFADLGRRHLNQLADAAQIVSYRQGTTVIREGDPGATLFVIVDGTADVSRGGRTLATLSPGEFFGEVSLLDGGPRTASIVAQTPLTAVRLFRAPFYRLVQAEPAIGVRVLAELARRIRRVDRAVRG
jgi:CRP/FNR family transcriptional regulator, cyclic AMP receptor protein